MKITVLLRRGGTSGGWRRSQLVAPRRWRVRRYRERPTPAAFATAVAPAATPPKEGIVLGGESAFVSVEGLPRPATLFIEVGFLAFLFGRKVTSFFAAADFLTSVQSFQNEFARG